MHILTEVHILTLKNWPPPNFELALEWTDVQKSQKWRRGSFFVFFFWAGGGGTCNFFAFERGNWVWGLVSYGDWYDRDSSKLSSLWSLLNNTAIILITHDLPANEEQEEYMVQALWICGPDIALLHYLTFIPGVLLWVHQHHPPPPPAPCHHDCGGDHMWGIPGFYFWGPRRGGATSRRQLYRIISAPSPLFILASGILSSWSSFKTLFWPTVYHHMSIISFRTSQKKVLHPNRREEREPLQNPKHLVFHINVRPQCVLHIVGHLGKLAEAHPTTHPPIQATRSFSRSSHRRRAAYLRA